MSGFFSIFGYPWIKKKAETSPFFNVINKMIRLIAFLVTLGVIILIVALALKKH